MIHSYDQTYVDSHPAQVPIYVGTDNVNRIIGGSFTNTHFSDLFSTNPSAQHTLLNLEIRPHCRLLWRCLGPLGPGESYQIYSTTLQVGALADGYSVASEAHEVLTPYDPATVTFASFNNGGVAGVDFTALAEATGVVDGPLTTLT